MVLGILITFIVVVAIAVIVNLYFDIYRNRVSFKEALDLTDLPVITLLSNEKKLNFLIDTGSNLSHINKPLIDNKEIEYEATDSKSTVYGMDGINRDTEIGIISLSHGSKNLKHAFLLNDLSAAFNSVKADTGVTLHGILGADFFNAYKSTIDFKSKTFKLR